MNLLPIYCIFWSTLLHFILYKAQGRGYHGVTVTEEEHPQGLLQSLSHLMQFIDQNHQGVNKESYDY